MSEFCIEAKIENMEAVLDFVDGQLDGCPPKVRNQIGIAVDEVFSNIARYAYHPDTGNAAIRVTVGSAVTIEFEDSGMAYDPLSAEEPDITLPAEEREVGGLGIFMVKKIMDSVTYRREEDKNILTIQKNIG